MNGPNSEVPNSVGHNGLDDKARATSNHLSKKNTFNSRTDQSSKNGEKPKILAANSSDLTTSKGIKVVAGLPPPNAEGTVDNIPAEVLDRNARTKKNLTESKKEGASADDTFNTKSKNETEEMKNFLGKEKADHLFPWSSVGDFVEDTNKPLIGTKKSKSIRNYIFENYYNDWYNNTGTVIGTCFFSWLLAYLNFSWWSLGFVLLCTASVYRAEFRRFNRNIRDDLKRVTVHETLSERSESSVWMNSFLSKFWVIYMPVLSKQVKDAVNPQLAGVAPGFGIDALSLDEFTLGSKAPTIDVIKSYTKKGKDTVEMDWTFSFTPNDESNMTPKEVQNKINPKIALGVTIGKGFVSKSLPILVEDINVAGTIKVTIKFGETFPNIKIVSVSMLKPPFIDFALKPIGGDTLGLDVMSFLPGLKTFVKSLITSNVGPILYAPNQIDVNVEEIMATQSQDAIGVVAVTVESASNLKTSDFLSTTIDPYIKLTAEKGIIGDNQNIRTTIKSDTKKPRWNETKYLLVNSLEQKLTMTCLDFNELRKDALVGSFEFNLADLYQKHAYEHTAVELKSGGKSKGLLNFSINWFPVLSDDSLTPEVSVTESDIEEISSDDEDRQSNQSDVGIIKFTLHKVKYLNTALALTGSLSPSAELYIDDKLVKSYRTLRRINEPSWEETLEVLVPSKSKSQVSLKVYDEIISGKRLLAEYSSSMEEILEIVSRGTSHLEASPQGEIYISALWKPVGMTGSFSVNNTIREPIGAVRIHLKNALVSDDDLSGIGDIDPYITVTLSKSPVFRTNFLSDTKDPNFNEVIYLPIKSENQVIGLKVYDYQKIGKDRFFGSFNISASDLLKKVEGSNMYEPIFEGSKTIRCNLINEHGRKIKSYINIAVEALAVLPVYYPHELTQVQQLEDSIKAKKKAQEENQAKLKQQMDKEPKSYEVVEVEDKIGAELEKLNRKQKITLEELVQHNSGVCIVQVTEALLSKPSSYLGISCDDVSYPFLISERSINGKVLPQNGTFFVRDLEHSVLNFRVSKRPVVKEVSEIVSETELSTLKLLKKGYEEPTIVTTKCGSKFKIRLLLNPTNVELPASETMMDTGMLELKNLSANEVPSHDKNGKSDPFLVIRVDGEKIFETEIVKKTLDPVWKSSATIPIISRTRNKITATIYDWDRTGSNDYLCETELDVRQLKPNGSTDMILKLEPQGTFSLNATFHPRYIRPPVDIGEGGLANFSKKTVGNVANLGYGAVVGVAGVGMGVAGAGVGVAGAGVGVVTGGLSKGGRFMKSFGKKTSKSNSNSHSTSDETSSLQRKTSNLEFDPSVPDTSYAPVQSQAARSVSVAGDSSSQDPHGAIHKRTISTASSFLRSIPPNRICKGRITIVAAENLGKSVQIRLSLAQGGKIKNILRTEDRKADEQSICTFNDAVEFRAPPEANIVFGAVSHHKFSRDTELGVAQINLGDPQIQQEGQIALRLGTGHLILKLAYPLDSDVPPIPQMPAEYK